MRTVQIIKNSILNLLEIITGVTTHRDVAEHLNKVTKNLNDLTLDVADIPDEIEKRILNHKPKISVAPILTTTDLSKVKGSVTEIDDNYTINLTVPITEIIDNLTSSNSNASLSARQGKILKEELDALVNKLNKYDHTDILISTYFAGDDESASLEDVLQLISNEINASNVRKGLVLIHNIENIHNELGIYTFIGNTIDDIKLASNWINMYELLISEANVGIKEIIVNQDKSYGGKSTVTFKLTDNTSKTVEIYNGTEGKAGQDGPQGVGISNISVVKNSTDDGAANTWRINMTDGTHVDISIYNGKSGSTPQLSIGTVSTGVAGSNANASISGTALSPKLNLTIPRGADGKSPKFKIESGELKVSYDDSTWESLGKIVSSDNSASSGTSNDNIFTFENDEDTSGIITSGAVRIKGGLSVGKTIWSDYGVWTNGYVSCLGQNTSSDERLKTDFKEINLNLDDIANAPSLDFKWVNNTTRGVGSIAQYWENILPNAVHKKTDGYLEMEYGNIALISAINLAREIRELKKQINDLKRDKLL